MMAAKPPEEDVVGQRLAARLRLPDPGAWQDAAAALQRLILRADDAVETYMAVGYATEYGEHARTERDDYRWYVESTHAWLAMGAALTIPSPIR